MSQPADPHALLVTFIQQESAALYQIVRSYVVRMGLVSPADAEQVGQATQELVNEVVIEALQHADRFDPARRPMPWLLGIGINRIRMKLRQRVRDPEIPVRDLYPATEEELGDDELFERFGAFIAADPAERIEQETGLDGLLAQLSDTDRQIVRLAILYDLNSTTIAAELGITPSAARVRLHRAVKRLRSWFELQRIAND